MKDKKTFGSFIREKRIMKNYSQKDLANLLFVTESAISKWERGITYPDITLITDICKVLDISERELIQSSDDVEYRKIKKDANKFNKIRSSIFWSFNIIYIIAILTCFIVNLAVNHTLSWFFIVLTSILTGYTFCPTVTWVYNKYKILIFLLSTFLSMFFLFLTCSIYTNNYWFLIPTLGVLLLYYILFWPIVFIKQKKYCSKEQYTKIRKYFLLTYSIGILLLIILLLIVINAYKSFNLIFGVVIAVSCMSIPIIFGILIFLNIKKIILKTIFISLIGLTILGSLIGIIRAVYLKTTEQIKNYYIEETYNKVNIEATTADIDIYFSNTNENRIMFIENEKTSIDIKIIDEVLIIIPQDNRSFYEQMFNFTTFKIDIYLSNNSIDLLNIKSSTSDITIHEGLEFNNIKISNSTGDILIEDCNNIGNVNIETSTGDIELINSNCNQLLLISSTGKITLKKVLVKNDLEIKAKTTSVYLDSFDANNIYITVSTGDVVGTILSSKFFIAKSDTGKVEVPETREGGECRITASTGDIIISYKK